jgi:hypothetical protein
VVAASGLANARGWLDVDRLDPSVTMNPQTLHRVSVVVNISWTTSIRNDVTAVRTKTATFSNIIAPE